MAVLGSREISQVPIFTQSSDSLQCIAIRKWPARVACVEHRLHRRHLMSASIAQAFVFKLGEKKNLRGELRLRNLQSYSHHVADMGWLRLVGSFKL